MTLLRTDGLDRCICFLHKWYATSLFVHNIGSFDLPITTTVTFECQRCSAVKTKDYQGKVFISFGQVIPAKECESNERAHASSRCKECSLEFKRKN